MSWDIALERKLPRPIRQFRTLHTALKKEVLESLGDIHSSSVDIRYHGKGQ
jgi:hypothetical protein